MKLTHTHRGHCQRCTMVQAIDPSTGNIAKHGYTVPNGYFNGTCIGADLPTLHTSREHADGWIAAARADAKAHRKIVSQLSSGKSHPVVVWQGEPSPWGSWKGVYHKVPKPTDRNPNATKDERTMISWADGSQAERERQVKEEIATHTGIADRADSYANDLEKWADRITGKVDAYQVKDLDPRDWQVGDTIRIGGKSKDGFDAVIEAIELRAYRTRGFSMRGSSTVNTEHGRITRPALPELRAKPTPAYPEGRVTQEAREARTWWEPLRNIKRPPTALAAMLKAEGKV